MGNADAKNTRQFKTWKVVDEYQDNEYGLFKILENPKVAKQLALEKAYSFVTMGFKQSDLKEIRTTAHRIPETFTRCYGMNAKKDSNFCSPDMLNIDAFFEYFTNNLLKYADYNKSHGKHSAEGEIQELIKFFLTVGCIMENLLEYHPFIGMKNVLITHQFGYKITNPYVYPVYLMEKKENIMNPIATLQERNKWTPDFFTSHKARTVVENEMMKDLEYNKMIEWHRFKIKQNVFQCMSIILCLGTNTKEHKYYENNGSFINFKYISKKIEKFRHRYHNRETIN